MVWILVLVALVAASVYGAHRLLEGVDAFGPLGRVRALPRALVYAAAVVVGTQTTDAALNIYRVVSDRQLGLPSNEKTQTIIQLLSADVTDVAWQAGLLLAAAALVASTSRGEPRSAQ